MKRAVVIKDTIKTNNLNRSLLMGGDAGTFNSFDLDAYLTNPKVRKPFSFKEATPELLMNIQHELQTENQKVSFLLNGIFVLSLLAAGLCIALTLWV